MEELYNLGISEQTLKNMLEMNFEISELSNKAILEKEELLKKINCSKVQILNIISSNPIFLSSLNEKIKDLLHYLTELGFEGLNTLIDSNPYILNLEVFEIKKYIDDRLKKGEIFDEIIDELDSNPYLFLEI